MSIKILNWILIVPVFTTTIFASDIPESSTPVDLQKVLKNHLTSKDSFIPDSLILSLNKEINLGSLESLNPDSLTYCTFQYIKAHILINNDEIQKADSILNSIIPFFDSNNNYSALGRIYNTKGYIYKKLNELDKAQEYNLISIKNLQKINDSIKLIQVYEDLGFVYLDLRNFKLGEEYFLKSQKLAIQDSIAEKIKSSTLALATSYLFQKKTTDALYEYNNLLKNHNLSDQDLSLITFNSATAHLINKNYAKAIIQFKECLILRENLKDDKGIIKIHNNLAKIYLLKEDYDLANKHLTKCYNYAKANHDQALLYSASYNMLDYFISIGKKDSAKRYLKEYTILRDSIKNIKIQTSLLELDKKYKTLEKDNQIALLQKEDELKEAQLSNQLLIIISITSVLLILLTLGYFINRQRIRLKSSQQNLQKQQKEIESINTELKLSNQAKDRILSIIGHDLRGPIGGLKELIELYMEMPEYDEDDFKNLLKAAREASTGSYHLLENLLTWANSQRGQIDFKPVKAPLLPLIKHSIDLLDSAIHTRNVSFEYQIKSNMKMTADLNMLRTIIRNLVSNAVKYSPPESSITISAEQNEKETLICIADKGYGMSAEQSMALFEKKETFYIEAGYNAKGSGLGLILCKEFVEQHNGHIWADSQPNIGTKVCFTIPVNINERKLPAEFIEHTIASLQE